MKRAKRQSKRKAGRKSPRKPKPRRLPAAAARKKAASKKKAAKKKAAKKKAAKKKGKKETVVLDPRVPLGEDKRRLSRTKAERICWKNKDRLNHRIVFDEDDEWPFTGSWHEILARALKTSAVLTVRSDATKATYDYEIIPEIEYEEEDDTPPDGPAVIVED